MRKYILPLLALCVAFPVFAEDTDLGSYDAYKESVKNYCEDVKMPWNAPGVKNSLLKYSGILYPDITNPNSDKEFMALMDSVKGNKENLNKAIEEQAKNMPIAGEIERASAIYAERMNAIYGCAVLNSKLRIHQKLLETFNPSGSNIVNKLKQTSDQIRKRIDEKQCRNVAKDGKEGPELSLKRQVIAQTTGEYCNYQHYLYYIDQTLKHRLGEVIALEDQKLKSDPKDSPRFPTSDTLAKGLADMAARADNEIARTKGVYGAAFDAYVDFERNYASHVIMIMIEDRYMVVRDYLREAMNPIGQVIYLASNATSTGK